MCGICGVLVTSPAGHADREGDTVRAMMARMARRGPDDEGIWSDGAAAVLGFRRLSVLDLSPAGHQPMLTPDGRYALVFNGEVYNFRELRRELEARGVRFRSSGDSEVVLQALAAWGARALSRFNGMFALAFYDRVERRLLLARDHAGIKPLYYLRTPEGVVFGSAYDQILLHRWAQGLAPSREGLGLYLRFGFTPAPHGLLEGTHMLDAGCWLSVDAAGRTEEGRYFEFPRSAPADLRGAELHEALEEALSRAVARQMVSDVPVGVFLSGGIDSPLVASEARRHAGEGLRAFSIGESDPALDESGDARRYAEELGLRQVVRTADASTALAMLDEVIEACAEPTADFSIFPTLMVSRLAREHVTVALSGDGGDELFWGYPGRFAPAIEQAPYFGQPRLARYALVAARRWLGRGRATRDVLWPSVGRLYQKKHTLFAEGDLRAIFPGLPPLPDGFGLFDYAGTDPGETAQWVRWNEFRLHLARVLLKVDRASMHHSLEVRVPLLDREVIDVAARADWRSCLDLEQRVGKLPLRAILSGRLRHHTVAKKGFTVPMHDWLAGPLQPLLREQVLEQQGVLGLELDRARLRGLNERMLRGDRSVAWGFWLLLSLALWERKHRGGSAPLRAA
jgi:asparagine synthase (glutamine-hydrolysing)